MFFVFQTNVQSNFLKLKKNLNSPQLHNIYKAIFTHLNDIELSK